MEWNGIVKSEMKWNFITCRHDKLKHGEMLEKGEEAGWGRGYLGQAASVRLRFCSPLLPPPSFANGHLNGTGVYVRQDVNFLCVHLLLLLSLKRLL